jgi:hypothetical protein
MRVIHGVIAAALVLSSTGVVAQREAKPDAVPTAKPDAVPTATPAASKYMGIPLRLQIVVSKYQGDKKLSSVPFTVSVTDNNNWNRLRAGARVPIPRAAETKPDAPTPYNYEQLGLSIDSRAMSLPNGAFQIEMNASDTSIIGGDQSLEGTILKSAPAFRTISLSSTTVLKDGQSTQLTTATDPISGVGMRIDVTLNVNK